MTRITESNIEQYTIETLESLGYRYIYGPTIAPEGEFPERAGYDDVVLKERLKAAIQRVNPDVPAAAQEQALREVLRISSSDILNNNEIFHRFLTDGVPVQYQQDGNEKGDLVWLLDFNDIERNEFVVINQYTIIENNNTKRPDVLLLVNGIPLVLIELKNAADEHATIRKAFDQIQTYKSAIPGLFTFNAFCIVSDGMECKVGSISSGFSRFMAWKTSDGQKEASRFAPQLQVLLNGMLKPNVLLDLVRNFIVFEKSKKIEPKTGIIQIETIKKIAAYHQYYAVNKALESTLKASAETGDRKGGVVWHTQGSGKSLSMVFYTGKLVLALNNPTVIVITDRNDLDDQLFDTFAASTQLLRQVPVQAKDRNALKELLKVASGGIVFTTIQKFMPADGKSEYDLLSDRKNIVVIADEAHRTQYGFDAKLVDVKDADTKEVIGKRIAYGFAKYMRDALPEATYIGFTGTPIESTDVNTAQVFGQYVDIYDISQAVEDGATVKIYYESRLAKVKLTEEGRKLVEAFDQELEEDQEVTDAQRAKAKWTQLEAIVGNKDRVSNLGRDIITHFEQRQQVFDGKGMIVSMSRRIAVELYTEIIKLRPDWHSNELNKGKIKVIMTASSSDGPEMAQYHTTKQQRRDLADRMKDPADPLQLVIVRDMWLTGFDAPSMHTLYIDKPMKGHNLMQAIARVNRVFKDKPGGLVVDYLGIGNALKEALSFYADAGGKGDPTEDQERAVEALIEKLEVVRQLFYTPSKSYSDIILEEPQAYYGNDPGTGFNYQRFFAAPSNEKLSIVLQAEEHILGLEDGKNRYIKEVTMLSKAFALSVPHEEALKIKDEVAFFQAVKARLLKFEGTVSGNGRSDYEIETAIKSIVNEALQSDQVIDIFDAAGIKKPEISILSEEFLLEIKGMKHKNLALELLKKILNDEIKARTKTNIIQSRKLLEMLEGSIKKYQLNLLSTAEIIQELIDLAKDIKKADKRGQDLGLQEDELAFYDALEVNDSAVQVLGDDQLRVIAKELAEKIRNNATIDWTIKESVRAKLMVLVRRTLNIYGYPPDKQAKAVDTVLKQAELLAGNWVK
jgi:type I restriction enzyme R subunit